MPPAYDPDLDRRQREHLYASLAADFERRAERRRKRLEDALELASIPSIRQPARLADGSAIADLD